MRLKDKLSKKKYWKQCVLYGFLIVFLANCVNYFLGLKAVRNFLNMLVQLLELDIFFYDFLNYTEPHLHLENLFFLKDWVWLLPYFVFALIMGGLYPFIYEKRLNFNNIAIISVCAYVFQLFSLSAPYGFLPTFLYFFDFFAKYYQEPLWLIPLCFIGLFLGTEIIVIWIQNAGAEKLMERYK